MVGNLFLRHGLKLGGAAHEHYMYTLLGVTIYLAKRNDIIFVFPSFLCFRHAPELKNQKQKWSMNAFIPFLSPRLELGRETNVHVHLILCTYITFLVKKKK